jgi:hypothetical protein
MKDFKIVHARSLLDIFSIAPIRGFSPPSIVVLGTDLNFTSEVLYNGIEATEFVISSSTRLIVRIPPSQVGKDLMDLQVYASRPTLRGDASLVMELTKPFKIVSGLDRLVQSWIMIFLTTPGTDVFSPQSGGGARSIVGSRTDRKQKSAAADLAQAIERTQSELIRLQSQNPAVPPEERLLSSSLESLSHDESTGVLSVRILLKNMVNQSANVSLG